MQKEMGGLYSQISFHIKEYIPASREAGPEICNRGYMVVGKICSSLSGRTAFICLCSFLLKAILTLIIILRNHIRLEALDKPVLPVVSIASLVQQAVPIHSG